MITIPRPQDTYTKSCKQARSALDTMLRTGLESKLREMEEDALEQLGALQAGFKKDLDAITKL